MVEKANAAGGDITAQVFPRPIGLMIGLELTANPFVLYPSYQEIAHLPLAERVAEMRKPEVRERILADTFGTTTANPLMYLAQMWEWIFPLGDNADYEPDRSMSILARAQARGVAPIEEAYDRLLDDDGHAILLGAMANFENNSLDTVGELIRRDDVVLGLGDGGAHYGMICDSSFPTYLLAHWARDRESGRLSVAEAVRELTSAPARVAGLADRGRIAVGYKADLNVIDHAEMRLHKPVIAHDLPAGGRRLDQTADGYVATIVSGEVIAENGVPTDARPGKLVRGRRPAPSTDRESHSRRRAGRADPTDGSGRTCRRCGPGSRRRGRGCRSSTSSPDPACWRTMPSGSTTHAGTDSGRVGAVHVDDVDLVGPRVGAGADQFHLAVAGRGQGGLDDHFRAEPGQLACGLREGAVVADRQTDPADAGNVEDDELAAGRGLLVGLPGEDLAVAGHDLAEGDTAMAVL